MLGGSWHYYGGAPGQSSIRLWITDASAVPPELTGILPVKTEENCANSRVQIGVIGLLQTVSVNVKHNSSGKDVDLSPRT